MAVSRPWDENAPQGSNTQANQIDENFRNLKVDIRERLEQVLTGFTTGVVSIIPGLIPDPGVKTGKTINIHHSAFRIQTGTEGTSSDSWFELNSGTAVAEVMIPQGVTITRFAAWVDRLTASAFNCIVELKKLSPTLGLTTLVSLTSNVNGPDQLFSGALTIPVSATLGEYYFVKFTSVVSPQRISAIQITYTTPNSASTI